MDCDGAMGRGGGRGLWMMACPAPETAGEAGHVPTNWHGIIRNLDPR